MRVCPTCRSTYSRKTQFCGLDGTRLHEREADPLVGETVGRFRIVELLGHGASGVVYRALHTELDTEFAVKVLFGDLASDETVVGRLRREAQMASKIRSPYVVTVVDFGTTEAGLTYLAMEYVPGDTLQTVIARDAPIRPQRVAQIIAQVAAGLTATHRLGLVHRDVKPANIMVIHEDGVERAKLLDFGIVRVAEGHEDTRLTKMGLVIGTPAYMSPEQARTSEVTFASDLYSLGVVMYELLTGTKPFRGESVASVLMKHAEEPPPPLPPCGGLEMLCLALLAKNPSDRPESAAYVAEWALDCESRLAEESSGSSSDSKTSSLPGRGNISSDLPARDLARDLSRRDLASRTRFMASSAGSPSRSQEMEPERVDLMSESVAEASSMSTTGSTNATRSRGGAHSRRPLLVAGSLAVLAIALSALGFVILLPDVFFKTEAASPYVVAPRDGTPSLPLRLGDQPVSAQALEPSASTIEDLQAVLRQRGLTLEDLTAVEGIGAEVEAWRALPVESRGARSTALDALMRAVERVPVTSKLVDAKLTRLDPKVARLRTSLPESDWRRFEAQYLELYRKLGSVSQPEALDALLKEVFVFEQRVKSLGSAPSARPQP